MEWIFLTLIALYGIKKYREGKEKKELEEKLPDALFQASSITDIASFEELIKHLSSGDSLLSKKFMGMHRQIENGIPTEEVLEEASKKESGVFARALRLLTHGYRTGSMGNALRETAEDINQTHEILRERAASTIVEKYTLLMAGGCIVPFILGSLVAMVSGIGFIEIGTGMEPGVRKAIIENATQGNMIYIIEYALLASFFVSIQESKPERTLIYAVMLVPIGLLIFHAARNGIAF